MNQQPSPNGYNGRDRRGRFAAGNPGGPGNPAAQRVARLRAALLKAIRPKDIHEIIRKLVEQAKAGDAAAAKEILNRSIGTPIAADVLARIEELENALGIQP